MAKAKQTLNSNDKFELFAKRPFNESVCHCINWHPSVKSDEGKKAKCSYCNKTRHAI